MWSRPALVALFLFGSGFCALVYQTTWLREFRLVFGASTAASAVVVGVFMAGLGFGGIVLGRRSERQKRPLKFYAQLEFLIALSAAISPLLIWGARHLYIALGGTQTLGLTVGTIVRLVLSVVILAVPTFLMGGTLPAAARAAVPPDDISRRAIGTLYGINTLGAVLGAGVGTFFLFEQLGNRLSLWSACLLNLLVAGAAWRLSNSWGDSALTNKAERPAAEEARSAPVSRYFVFAAAGIVGFAFFLMELVWYRMLGPLLGGSTFSFGIILGVALLGIGLGGATYATLNLRRAASLYFFAVTCAAEALFVALPYAMGDRIALAAMLLRPLGTLGFYGHVVAWTIICAIVVFPAAFVAGLQFPVLIALLGQGRARVGLQTGAAYSWNTLGALLGSFAGGFGLIPLLSAPGVWRLVVVLLSVLAAVATVLVLRERSAWRRVAFPAVAIALALFLLRATGPTAFWRHSQIGVGRLAVYTSSPNGIRDIMRSIRRQTIWETDGVESSVALADADSLAFIVNGRSDGNARHDAGTQIMSGLIGVALHPHPTHSLVIGLGTGSTAGWLAAMPGMEGVDAVELEPAVLHVAQKCSPVNQNAMANPKLHVQIGDAREVLLTTRQKYDIIVSEPSNPYRAGVAGLFTSEYYRSVDRCLQPGGLFFQWVQAYDIDERTLQIFYKTLGSVFANVDSWQSDGGDLLLMASHDPLLYDVDSLRERITREPLKTALLGAWRAASAEEFLAHFVGNNALAAAMERTARWPLNTDDRTIIEFAFARSVNLTNGFPLPALRATAAVTQADRPFQLKGDVDWARVGEARLSMYASLNRAEKTQTRLTPPEKARAAAFTAYMDGDLAGALRQWRTQNEEPKSLRQLAMLAECLAADGAANAPAYIDKLAETSPADALAIRAEFFWRSRDPVRATESLEEFFRTLQRDPWPARELVRRSLTRADTIARSDRSKIAARMLYAVVRNPFCIYVSEGERLTTQLALATYLDGDRPGENTRQAIQPFEPHLLWQRAFLQLRKDCYANLRDPRAAQASRDLEEFSRRDSSAIDTTELANAITTPSPSPGDTTETRP